MLKIIQQEENNGLMIQSPFQNSSSLKIISIETYFNH